MIPCKQRNTSGMEPTAPGPGDIDKPHENDAAPTDQPGRARKGERIAGVTVTLTEYEYALCDLFSKESAKTQQAVEFGQKRTKPRSVEEIARDTMIGKMAEAAVARVLWRDYKQHLPINYQIYPMNDCDDEDIRVNGWTLDIKSTRKGKWLLLETAKVRYRMKTGTMPDVIVMCRTPWDEKNDRPQGREVELIGCISTQRLTGGKVLKAGECIPGTGCRLQADNYGIKIENLSDFNGAVEWMLQHKAEA